MCEITARTKPRVDFIIILLLKVPRVSDFAFAFFHRASSFLLFPSTYVVLHFLSFISHSFSTSFSFFFSFPQISRFTSTCAHLPSSVCYLSRFFLSLGAGGRSSHPPHLPLSAFPRSSLYFSISPVRCILLLSKQGDQPSQG